MVSLKRFIILSIASAAFGNIAQAQSVYCCHDPVSGRRICGDILPNQCKGIAYKVYDRVGNVVKEVAPPLTAEQKIAKAAQEQRKRDHEELLREQRRKDAALLETYSNIQDIDLSLARAEADFKTAMQSAVERIKLARLKRKKFEGDAEFYKKNQLPPDLRHGLREVDEEIRAHSSVLISKKNDLEAVRVKHAADKKRYLEIMAGGGVFNHPDAKRQIELQN